jgi:hypothetical protein
MLSNSVDYFVNNKIAICNQMLITRVDYTLKSLFLDNDHEN